MRQDDFSELRAVLREAVAACRRSNRDLEDDLGLGHGSLQRLLDGPGGRQARPGSPESAAGIAR